MKTIYRKELIEEGKHNLIFTNRCGLRLTVKIFEEDTQLEFIYKPNAFRRKDFAGRNFSNRDIYTTLFKEFSYPDIAAKDIGAFHYDPFDTKVDTRLYNGGKNSLTFLNMADENCFVLSAKSPLTLAFKPHGHFKEEDGLLTETFHDRGESITSFIKFTGFAHNRFRVLNDGTYVLQICMDDIIIVGGEENERAMRAALNKLGDILHSQGLTGLREYNEKIIRQFTDQSVLKVIHPKFQEVIDLNKRLTYSMVDEGGVSFGALQVCYYLIWVRDLMMSTSMFAAVGMTDLIKLSYPLVYDNPAIKHYENEDIFYRYQQMVGTHWTKYEDDGIFYVVYGLYHLFRSTAADTYLASYRLKFLIDAVDDNIKRLYDKERGIFGSDTLGETTLKSSLFFGYDAVNGSVDEYVCPTANRDESVVVYSYSLYQNVNMYNALRMLEVMIRMSKSEDDLIHQQTADQYEQLANELHNNILKTFANENGMYSPGILIMDDGKELLIEDFSEHDKWEFTWAVSLAPFILDINLSLQSCKKIREVWREEGSYGYCPWNTMTRFLKEYGLSDDEYTELMNEQMDDALRHLDKYPMRGALMENADLKTEWKGLPFGAGSMMYNVYSLILQQLPMGLAVRASDLVEGLKAFCYKNASISVTPKGKGQSIDYWTINHKAVRCSLQIPEGMLRTGHNEIVIHKANKNNECKLYSSNGILENVNEESKALNIYFPARGEAVIDNMGSVTIQNDSGELLPFKSQAIKGTSKTQIIIDGKGNITITFS